MSNSPLVSYRRWSPNCDSRQGTKIADITIHHMAGNLTVEQCGSVFASKSREASAHYGIGTDGRVGQYVDESMRAWANANGASNRRSVTIELANDVIGGNWHVSDKALTKCIDLVTDICLRNGITKLNYTGTTSGNLTRHNMFASTTCPGSYLQSKFPYIAEEVNKRLGNTTPVKETLDVDGYFGYKSTLRLQKWMGTYQDGEISGQTKTVKPYLTRLTSATYEGGGSACIKALQKYLNNKGYKCGTTDGLCGKMTVSAIQSFLNAQKFDVKGVDGYFGENTAKAFQRFLNSI